MIRITVLCLVCMVCSFNSVTSNNVHEMKIAKGFSWRNCNTTEVPVAFRRLSVSPNPIQYGGTITLTAIMEVTKAFGVTDTVKADIEANEILQGQKFDLCSYKPDACHIQDVCQKISQAKIPCPDVVKKMGSNCHCPLKAKTYALKDISVKIPNSKIQIEGQFEVKVDLKEAGNSIGCLYVEFCLGSCTPE